MKFQTKNKILNFLFIIIVFLFFSLVFLYKLFPLSFIVEINKAAREYTLPSSLVAATIKMESNFNERAVSSSGAFGLMQLMPDTAEWLYQKNIIIGNWREPENNILMGSYYLKSLILRFEDISLALNGYHKGPNKIQRMLNANEFFDRTYSNRILLYKTVYTLLYKDYLNTD
jgi:soluble lytic murein transglycosylase